MASVSPTPSTQQEQTLTSTQTPVPQVLVPNGLLGNTSLYVGDLDPSVTEGQLFDIFSQAATVLSVRVCRDLIKRVSLGYAYINFSNAQDATNALEQLNFTPINGKPIRIMFSQRDPSVRKSGQANVFVKNLDASIDNKALNDTFAAFGTVLSCKVVTDDSGQSKGYGFVQFEEEESAQNAIKRLNGMLINDKQVYVGLFVRKQERDRANVSSTFTNVYVKNLSDTTTDEDLKKVFGNYGPITSAVVMRDANGNSRGFGFVNFQNSDDAAAAVDKVNGSTFNDDKVWYVGRAQRKFEREAELKSKYEQERVGGLEKLQGANLYLKNLDDSITDENLKELFSEFGTITSCKVMLDNQGQSRGSGFVAFSTPEEATKALNEMNGKIVGRKPLYVAVAQRKDERKTRLQAQFSQIRPVALTPVLPGMPGFHPGGPRLGPPQQLYFSQGPPGLVSPQPAYGYQQLLPGIRPGVAPNFLMPYHLQRQGQPGQRMGARPCHTTSRNTQGPQQVPHQMQRNPNQGFRYYPTPRSGMEPSWVPQGHMSRILPMLDSSGKPVPTFGAPRGGPMPINTLASALASAVPEQQHVMLGEQLFPLVERLDHDLAAKITGMLLEMDQTEVLHLIESPDALKKKVNEAKDVLRLASSGSDAADKLGSLSLND